jgi:hypothetical protein
VTTRLRVLLVAPVAAIAVGCGGESRRDASEAAKPDSAELRRQLDEATRSVASEFPAVGGRTLQQVADGVGATGPQVGLATSVFTAGEANRLAFGVIDPKSGFVYGKTAVYFARTPQAKAQGPFPAPADLLLTDGRYRSRTAASEDDPFSAIYSTSIRPKKPGKYVVLVTTKVRDQLVAANTTITVSDQGRVAVPAVGDSAPRVQTDTETSARGDIESIDTRVPPDDMHETSFADVVGKKPVALLFATPQLCQSQVCGPVVDIAQQLKSKYGDRMEFIHQEVYVDNKVDRGIREPLERFGLRSEPWLFTIDRDGRVAARLEGSFGFNAFNRAIQAAL